MSLPNRPNPILSASRRFAQTGLVPRAFPARWLAVLLMGSVGAAWALNPGEQDVPPSLDPVSTIVVEGEPVVVSQLVGSLLGEAALPSGARSQLQASQGRRVVAQAEAVPVADAAARDQATFLRTVEELEADYVASGQYPAVPSSGAQGGLMSYRTDGEQFDLRLGHRQYTSAEGLAFGAAPAAVPAFEVQGFLEPRSSGWGPWRSEGLAFQPRSAEQAVEGLGFLEELEPASAGTARLFFPVDRATCGYLFRQIDGSTLYHSGELRYDALSGTFALKLFRDAQATTRELNPSALEAELAAREGAVAFVGESGLLSDLGLLAKPQPGEEVVAVSSPAVWTCSASSALDGLRLASLARRKEVLPAGSVQAGDRTTVVGRLRVQDKLGQIHDLRLRGGRGANYDWLVGQLCPESQGQSGETAVVTQAASYETAIAPERQVVKAGR